MGRKNEIVTKEFTGPNSQNLSKEVDLFTWEKLDYADAVKSNLI